MSATVADPPIYWGGIEPSNRRQNVWTDCRPHCIYSIILGKILSHHSKNFDSHSSFEKSNTNIRHTCRIKTASFSTLIRLSITTISIKKRSKMPDVVSVSSFHERGGLAVPKTSYLPTRSDMPTKKRKIICFSGKNVPHTALCESYLLFPQTLMELSSCKTQDIFSSTLMIVEASDERSLVSRSGSASGRFEQFPRKCGILKCAIRRWLWNHGKDTWNWSRFSAVP